MDKLQVRAMLASAVKEGILNRGIMKNIEKTPYWYFSKTDVEEKDK